MIRLLRFLITGDWHLHEWDTIRQSQVFNTTKPSDGMVPIHIDYILCCKRCGIIKKVRT